VFRWRWLNAKIRANGSWASRSGTFCPPQDQHFAFVRLPDNAELNVFTAAVAAAASASFVLQRLNPLADRLHFPFSMLHIGVTAAMCFRKLNMRQLD